MELIEAINREIGRQAIHLLHPSHGYRNYEKNGKGIYVPNGLKLERLTGIFTCEIEGKSPLMISEIAKKLGVYIAPTYEDARPNSFRIALHPYMSDDSIAALGEVLRESMKRPGIS